MVRRVLSELDGTTHPGEDHKGAAASTSAGVDAASPRGGFPWIRVAGRRLKGWVVVDLMCCPGTLVTGASRKEGATRTLKGTSGFHRLGDWCANTCESLAMELRPGNAGAGQRWFPPDAFFNALGRDNAEAEDHIRTGKVIGLHKLPHSHGRSMNARQTLAVALERLAPSAAPVRQRRPGRRRFGHHCASAPTTCLPAWPATPAVAACALSRPGPGHRRSPQLEAAHSASGQSLMAGIAPTRTRKESSQSVSGPVDPAQSWRGATDRPTPAKDSTGVTAGSISDRTPLTNRGSLQEDPKSAHQNRPPGDV